MASTTRRLLLQSQRSALTVPTQRACPRYTAQWTSARSLSSTPARLARSQDDSEGDSAPQRRAEKPAAPVTHTPEELQAQLRKFAEDFRALDPAVQEDARRRGANGLPIARSDNDLQDLDDFEEALDDKRAVAAGFWAEGEEGMGPDEDYYGDDITSDGDGQLMAHRYLRKYARLIAWEMPLLSQLAQPFSPPTATTPFRFRYTSYLGESHPAANKVVVEFSPSDLSLTPLQRAKLIKLAGPRYNPTSDLIKLSTEAFDTQTQNKRFLGDTITSLIAEAKDKKDTFEDVPFDFRHVKEKKRHEFPKEWVLTEERKKYLEEKRRETARLEDERRGNGKLVDGQVVVETSLPFLEQAQEVPVLIEAGKRK
ncbi:37S ribosomal protein S24, mitochondrial [Curvularia kusanoi]|uniref:37S ribosomal protein S24, mitochondrial n=1 Tax=Curvularia kusanoi TaxID=90978 RepID=A0A9P4T3V9_CURKU|nr:37S ribosomal protein S24, mitochondrial [Curvularia kusanoi]